MFKYTYIHLVCPGSLERGIAEAPRAGHADTFE